MMCDKSYIRNFTRIILFHQHNPIIIPILQMGKQNLTEVR